METKQDLEIGVTMCRYSVSKHLNSFLNLLQIMLTQYEIGYFSGFIDGEGTISLRKRRDRGGNKYDYVCEIGNTNKEIMEFIQKKFSGRAIYKRIDKRSNNRKPLYSYMIPRKTLREILTKIKLKIKKRQQELLIEALNLSQKTLQIGIGYPKSTVKRLDEIEKEMKVLNHRGLDANTT